MTNEQKYKTPEERINAYTEYLKRVGEIYAVPPFRWLTLEAEDEKIEPCPFCGDEVEKVKTLIGKKVLSCSCGYTSKAEFGWDEAIAAHNRVACAVRAANNN